MATEAVVPQAIVMADFKGKVDPDWCPGCGDFGVLAAVQKALVELQIPKHEVATISGIGCSSNFPGFIDTYGMHTLHGRSLPVATGMKMANHAMTVLVTGGDGDGFGIGGKIRRGCCGEVASGFGYAAIIGTQYGDTVAREVI